MIKINEIINKLKLTGIYLDDSFKLCRGVNSISYLVKEKKDNQYFYLFVTEYDPKTVTYQGHIAGTKAAKTVKLVFPLIYSPFVF